MREHIVFINQNAGYLMVDIVNAHRAVATRRTLVTGKLLLRNTPLDEDVKTQKVISYSRTSTVKRLFTWGWGFIQIVYLVKTKYRDAHLYLVTNPPLVPFLARMCSNSFSLLVFDVYPDALVEYRLAGANSWLIRWWGRTNRKIMAKATDIFVISEGMKERVAKYVEADKIRVQHLWTDSNFLRPIAKADNPFIHQHGLSGKFVVMYSGNLGFTHNLEVILRVAALLLQKQDVIFLIIGEGGQRTALEELAREQRLSNVVFLPWQEVAVLPYSLAAADLAIISLGKEGSRLSVPSKTYNFMSVGVPLLCIADESSELSKLVYKYQCGVCFLPEELKYIQSFITEVVDQPEHLNKLRQKALEAARDFTSSNALGLLATQ